MSKNISLKSIKLQPLFKKYSKKYGRHTVFGVLIAVLLIYVLVVCKINSLANAEPGPDQETAVTNSIPKINAKDIQQIQDLENNSTQVHSLFEQARNNPFQE
jgi:predicted PurR-regulated permease PerM